MKNPIAAIETTRGRIEIELYPQKAPNTVRSFIRLAQQGLFDGREIRRIVPGFVIQPSYSHFDDPRGEVALAGEYALNGFENTVPFRQGTVAMGGTDKVASGSCFFITLSDEAGKKLDGRFAAFGQVISGWEEVKRLEHVPLVPVTEPGMPEGVRVNVPVTPEKMLKVTVETWGETYPEPEYLSE